MTSGAIESRDTVLILDDDMDLRQLIQDLGSMVDVRVIHAANCCEGVAVLEKEFHRIKLILLDYFMPGMMPSECVAALKNRVGDEIPIVLFTASVDPSERAQELKLDKWISKPFDVRVMQRVLKTAQA